MKDSTKDHLFRAILLSALRDAHPDVWSDDDEVADKAIKAHADKLHGRVRGNVDQLAILTEGARSHRKSGENPPPAQRNKKQKPFDDATARVRKMMEESGE